MAKESNIMMIVCDDDLRKRNSQLPCHFSSTFCSSASDVVIGIHDEQFRAALEHSVLENPTLKMSLIPFSRAMNVRNEEFSNHHFLLTFVPWSFQSGRRVLNTQCYINCFSTPPLFLVRSSWHVLEDNELSSNNQVIKAVKQGVERMREAKKVDVKKFRTFDSVDGRISAVWWQPDSLFWIYMMQLFVQLPFRPHMHCPLSDKPQKLRGEVDGGEKHNKKGGNGINTDGRTRDSFTLAGQVIHERLTMQRFRIWFFFLILLLKICYRVYTHCWTGYSRMHFYRSLQPLMTVMFVNLTFSLFSSMNCHWNNGNRKFQKAGEQEMKGRKVIKLEVRKRTMPTWNSTRTVRVYSSFSSIDVLVSLHSSRKRRSFRNTSWNTGLFGKMFPFWCDSTLLEKRHWMEKTVEERKKKWSNFTSCVMEGQ